MTGTIRIVAVAALSVAAFTSSGIAEQNCDSGLREVEDALTRTRLESSLTETQVREMLESAHAAREAGEMEECESLIHDLRMLLRLDN